MLVPKDFKGKVGRPHHRGLAHRHLSRRDAGAGRPLARADVERQVTGGTPGAIEILKQGRVDCFISTLSVKVALERAKEPVEVWNPDKYLPLPGQNYLAMPDTIQAKPDLVLRFLRAIKASALEMMAGPIGAASGARGQGFRYPGRRRPRRQRRLSRDRHHGDVAVGGAREPAPQPAAAVGCRPGRATRSKARRSYGSHQCFTPINSSSR